MFAETFTQIFVESKLYVPMFNNSHKKEHNWYDMGHCLRQFWNLQNPGELNCTPFIPAPHAYITEGID